MTDRKTAVFVIGTPEYAAVRRGDALTDATVELLEKVSERANLDVDLVFVSLDSLDAGKNKAKLSMKKIKKERPRVLSEIDQARPDLVICFGPVASACVWGKGNLVEGELLRQAHYPLRPELPVYVTFSIEAMAWKAGLAKWLEMDVYAAAHGQTETEWGNYTVLLPGTKEWDECPQELSYLIRGARAGA